MLTDGASSGLHRTFTSNRGLPSPWKSSSERNTRIPSWMTRQVGHPTAALQLRVSHSIYLIQKSLSGIQSSMTQSGSPAWMSWPITDLHDVTLSRFSKKPVSEEVRRIRVMVVHVWQDLQELAPSSVSP